MARPTGVCAATGERLEPGSLCVAVLCERAEDGSFDRRDYSLKAWEAGHRPERLFSYWKTAVPDPQDRRKILVDDEVLLDLFDNLADDRRRQRVAYRFIIALILLRKRLLRYKGRTGRGENEKWLMLPKGAEGDREPIEVINPHLEDSDIRELSDQLSEILQGRL